MRQSKRLQELMLSLLEESPRTQRQLFYHVRRMAPYVSRKLKTDGETLKFNLNAMLVQGIIKQDEKGIYHIENLNDEKSD